MWTFLIIVIGWFLIGIVFTKLLILANNPFNMLGSSSKDSNEYRTTINMTVALWPLPLLILLWLSFAKFLATIL